MKTVKKILKSLFFKFNCVLSDVQYIHSNWKRIKSSKEIETVFVCDINFYKLKKWQVASQEKLWYEFVERNDLLLCGSVISYLIYGRKSRNIVSLEAGYNAPKIKFGNRHNKIIMFVSDSHSKSWLPKYIEDSNITDIITPYKKTLEFTNYYKPLEKNKVHSFPWCVNEDDMLNVNIESRSTEILGFGKTGTDVYDLREWSFNTGELSAFNYAGSGNKKFSGGSFYHWLREFDACVVAMSSHEIYNYTVAKYFEVPSQGLLLFAFPSEDMQDLGFIHNENCIFVSKENFYDEIKKYKKSPEEYISIRKNGFDFIKNFHTINNRLEFLEKLLVS